MFKLSRLWAAVNVRRPHNGFTTTAWILNGWTAQPDYRVQ
jgi:hypothetical protein